MTKVFAAAACALAVGWQAAIVSAQSPIERAWTILEQNVASEQDMTRIAAIEALGLLVQDDRARRLAESKLTDVHADVRAGAVAALGQIGLPASVPALKGMLQDKETEVVFAATSALLQLGDPAAFQVYYAVLTGERKTGEPLLASQMNMLKDPDALARIGLETGIGFVPFGGMSYKVVKSFRQDNVSPVRAAAAQKLATDPDPATGRALAAAAADEKWLVRASAISAIARRGDAALVSAVVPRLDDENETVRSTAAAAIVRLGRRTGAQK
jgi:HEAT repeat protein